jgi:hypothetical protein
MRTQNGVMMLLFRWYTPADGTLWEKAASRGGTHDMRRLLDGTLARQRGRDVVSFVEDLTGHVKGSVVTDDAGRGELRCPGGSVSVRAQE